MDLHVRDVAMVGPITGVDSANRTAARWDIYGADLGHMFLHEGELYMIFGDTYGRGGLGGEDWRSNTMARIASPDPQGGLLIEAMITREDGGAQELIPSAKISGIERTVIPTYGISVDGRMYLHYMSVRNWGAPGHWNVRHSGFAWSDDDGHTWHTPERAIWYDAIGFEQVALVEDGDYVYTFGIPEGRFGGVRLRRVRPGGILDKQAYEYWNGNGWAEEAAAATRIVPAPVGELSVAWSEAHQRWVMMYLNPERKAIVLRTAPALTGPWGAEQVVVTGAEYPGLYSPYIVPKSLTTDGVYFTLSLWGDYNVYLMHAEFGGGQRPDIDGIIAEQNAGEAPAAGG